MIPKYDKIFNANLLLLLQIGTFLFGVKAMNVTIESSGSVVIAYLIGEIDHHTAADVRKKIDDVINYKKPMHLILDFKNVTFMDSSGIGLVMGRYRLLQSLSIGTSLEIKNVTPQSKKIMELAGLGRVAVIREVQNEENQ